MIGCSVQGCNKPHDSHGYCGAHRARWKRYGDPLVGRTSEGEPERFYREVVLPYDGDECLIWPYGRSIDGRASMWGGRGQTNLVHRRLCEETHGSPPTTRHQAAHSCGRGSQACVTKGHLSWKTQAENEADKINHGTTNRGERGGAAKLCQSDVMEIRRLRGALTQQRIADRFGVKRTTISGILNGRTWSHLQEGHRG